MSWGYGNCSTISFSQDMQNNKKLINVGHMGTRIYKSTFGDGVGRVTITFHDNRKTGLKNRAIVTTQEKSELIIIPELKTFKEIYNFIEKRLIELNYISKM